MLDLMPPRITPPHGSLDVAHSSPKFNKNFENSVPVRFWSRVAKLGEGLCWPWTGSSDGKYGEFCVEGKTRKAHRVAYELAVGPIPEGLTIDHVAARGCKGGLCCNPAHLEPVTQSENVKRYYATLPPMVQCPAGHEPRPRGSGDCKKCRVLAVARTQAKNPEKYRAMKREQKRKERASKRGLAI